MNIFHVIILSESIKYVNLKLHKNSTKCLIGHLCWTFMSFINVPPLNNARNIFMHNVLLFRIPKRSLEV